MNQAQKILVDISNLGAIATKEHKCGVQFDIEGNPTAGFIMVGKNSSQYRNVQREMRIENLQRSAQRKVEQIDTATAEGAGVVISAVEEQDHRTAVAVITGWFGFGNGETEVPFDASRVPGILQAMPTWQNAVLKDLERDANFMPASSKG